MTLLIDKKDIKKLESKKKAKKPIRKKAPVRPERNLEKRIQQLRKDIIGDIIENLKAMIKRNDSPIDIAEYLERELMSVENKTRHKANFIIDIWKSEMDEMTKNQFQSVMQRSLSVDVTAVLDSPLIREALDMGGKDAANLIVKLPIDTIGQIAQAVSDNYRGILPEGQTLIGKIQDIAGVSHSRAKLIARDQTTKMNAVLDQARQTSAGIEMYEWSTAGDLAVVGNPAGMYPKGTKKHKNHWLMNGMYCRWDDPTIYSDDQGRTWKKRTEDMPHVHTGIDIACRCVPLPIIDIDKILDKALAA